MIIKALILKRFSSQDMDTETRVQILDNAVCISYCTNTFLERYTSNYTTLSYE